MMSFRASVWTGIFLALIAGLPDLKTVRAEIYQYITQDGVVHFTNTPTDPRYRRMTGNKKVSVKLSPASLHKVILSEAYQHQLDPALVKAVIKVESDFNPSAISPAGAMGLMQLMPETANTLNVEDPFNPYENIAGGVRHLRSLFDHFDGDLTLALAAYHAGEERVQRYGQVPPIEATHRYVQKVMAAYQAYQRKVVNGPIPSISSGVGSWRRIYKVLTIEGEVIYTDNPAPYQDVKRYQVTVLK